MLGCSSLLPTEIAFLIHYSSFKSLLATRWILPLYIHFVWAFFSTSLMKESMITDRPLVLTPPALCFLRLRSRATLLFFFFLHLIPAHTFLILILQVASYKPRRVRVVYLRHFSGLHRFGSHFQIKYGSGSVPCSIFTGLFGFGYEFWDPWRPLMCMLLK